MAFDIEICLPRKEEKNDGQFSSLAQNCRSSRLWEQESEWEVGSHARPRPVAPLVHGCIRGSFVPGSLGIIGDGRAPGRVMLQARERRGAYWRI